MTTVIPRYFRENNQLKDLSQDKVFGVEFRYNTDVTRYNLIATSHVLVFVLKGEKNIHHEDGDILVKSGSFVFIPKGSYILSDVTSIDDEFKRLVLFFEDIFLKEFFESLEHKKVIKKHKRDIVTFKISPLMSKALESLEPYLNNHLTYGESMMKAKLYEILLHVLENDSKGEFLSVLKHVLSSPKIDLRHYMEANFKRPLTVSEFAQLSCRSTRQFNRDFKELYGESPQKWIRNRRLELAYQLLNMSEQSISDICYDSGFRNYSNFIQLFRQKFNITPKKLRAEN